MGEKRSRHPPAAFDAVDLDPPLSKRKKASTAAGTAGSSKPKGGRARSAPKAAPTSRASQKVRGKKGKKVLEAPPIVDENGPPSSEDLEVEDEEEMYGAHGEAQSSSPAKKRAAPAVRAKKDEEEDGEPDCFVGDPVPDAEARQRWPNRYTRQGDRKGKSILASTPSNDEEDLQARRHYSEAHIDGCSYKLNDCAYVKAEEGVADYICRIIEFFETTDRKLYFTAQWFFRAEDTIIKQHGDCREDRRVFLSEETNANTLDCIVSKVQIVRVAPNVDLEAKMARIPSTGLYYDMSYSVAYSTFANLPPENLGAESGSSSGISSVDVPNVSKGKSCADKDTSSSGRRSELNLLDLYSGCGAMSSGLCLGTDLSGVNLQTRWAVDINSDAIQSLKLNHRQAEVRNEKAEDFLSLLVEWEKLCDEFVLGNEDSLHQEMDDAEDDDAESSEAATSADEFEVHQLVGICYGDPHQIGNVGLKFKVRWKGYDDSDEDTWEPREGLCKCEERIQNFVRNGYKKNILPLPGKVDVICGGPPCQGISGFNRFRNSDAPLKDTKNQQMEVFMEIVDFLKPQFVLMENVVDILKFANGHLGRYAVGRLVSFNYQTRLGIMAAGSYGLPQFRMRVFLWGAHPSEILPAFPLPTHNVVVRGGAPNEFEQNVVGVSKNQNCDLEPALNLSDAISDLPAVTNFESRDEMPYGGAPKSEFQRFIRLPRLGDTLVEHKLFDHRPLLLNDDDYQRVCLIPRRKGANFRDLPGVIVGPDNVVQWDPSMAREYLPSGKPVVPDYAMTFIRGKSLKPFARLWWDETVATVVTRAEPHNHAVMHPEQDRVLTVRENARLQGFPDYYKLHGPIKERYKQVGNAVAVPVARALGYALGHALQGRGNNLHIFSLPQSFPKIESNETVE